MQQLTPVLGLATTIITAISAKLELRGMGGHALLNCAEKQFAVGAGSGNRPACTDASIHDQVLSCHETRRIAGQEQCGLRDIIHAADISQRLPSCHDRTNGGLRKFRMVIPPRRVACPRTWRKLR